MFTKPFGVVVRERREANDLLQKDLARAAGISPQRLCQIELCQRQPTIDQQRRLQRALGRIGAFVEPSGVTRKLCSNGRRQFLVEGPRYDPPRDRSTFIRFAMARSKYPDFVRGIMLHIQGRSDFEECQALCHQIVAESAEEVLLILRLLHAGAEPCFAAPKWMVDIPYQIVDPRAGGMWLIVPQPALLSPATSTFSRRPSGLRTGSTASMYCGAKMEPALLSKSTGLVTASNQMFDAKVKSVYRPCV